MSNFEDIEYVGKNHPPRKHRFSTENQPKGRRSRRNRMKLEPSEVSVAEELLAQLTALVTVTRNGKSTKKPFLSAFVLKLIKNAADGSSNDQIRFLEFLRKYGLLDVFELQARLEREARQDRERIEASVNEWRRFTHHAAGVGDTAISLAVDIGLLLRKQRQQCTCNCLTGDEAASADEFDVWIEEALQHCKVSGDQPQSRARPCSFQTLSKYPASPVRPTDVGDEPPLDDDFYTGQIGND